MAQHLAKVTAFSQRPAVLPRQNYMGFEAIRLTSTWEKLQQDVQESAINILSKAVISGNGPALAKALSYREAVEGMEDYFGK